MTPIAILYAMPSFLSIYITWLIQIWACNGSLLILSSCSSVGSPSPNGPGLDRPCSLSKLSYYARLLTLVEHVKEIPEDVIVHLILVNTETR